jgi:hypothetical protein
LKARMPSPAAHAPMEQKARPAVAAPPAARQAPGPAVSGNTVAT